MRGSAWKSQEDRFWSKVDKRGPDECWPWKASLRNGYGQYKVGGKRGKMVRAHRVAWVMVHGEIPVTSETQHGTCVCHRCDNPLCVNPRHLFLGTQIANIKGGRIKGRYPRPTAAQRKAASELRRGRHGPAKKLTSDDVLKIRALKKGGVSARDIAERFDLGTTTVHYICSGKAWSWLK